jgi:hypothetical protein
MFLMALYGQLEGEDYEDFEIVSDVPAALI